MLASTVTAEIWWIIFNLSKVQSHKSQFNLAFIKLKIERVNFQRIYLLLFFTT